MKVAIEGPRLQNSFFFLKEQNRHLKGTIVAKIISENKVVPMETRIPCKPCHRKN